MLHHREGGNDFWDKQKSQLNHSEFTNFFQGSVTLVSTYAAGSVTNKRIFKILSEPLKRTGISGYRSMQSWSD